MLIICVKIVSFCSLKFHLNTFMIHLEFKQKWDQPGLSDEEKKTKK